MSRRPIVKDLSSDAYVSFNSMRLCRVVTGFYLTEDEASTALQIPNEDAVVRTMDQLLELGQTSFFLPSPTDRYAASLRRLVGRSTAEDVQFIHSIVLGPRLAGFRGSQRSQVSRRAVEDAVDACLLRSGSERLDIVLLEWHDPADSSYLDALYMLTEIAREGKIRASGLGVAGFSILQLQKCEAQGLPVACVCVEFSILDQRPVKSQLLEYCRSKGIFVFARDPLYAGLLSSRWLGVPEPPLVDPSATTAPSRLAPGTIGAAKISNLIRCAGGWGIFQECMFCLHALADKHKATIPQVATRWVLERVDAVIFTVSPVLVGVEDAGEAQDCIRNGNLFTFELDADDVEAIREVAKHSRYSR
jgi:aryl-alcohol dehydrogenase-like predicted oxidoreductase